MKGPVLALVVVLLATSSAVAQPSEAVQRADQLFQEGRKLLDAGNAAAACPKFEESQRLDPGLGTLLNLADCYERTGRLASALSAFRSSEEQARRLGEKRRETAAADRARALEGRVPRVTITLAAGERPTGFEVRRNGAVVTALDYGPDVCVETAAGAPIIDVSPLVGKELFGEAGLGYSDQKRVTVTEVDASTPVGACVAGMPTEPPPSATTCMSTTLDREVETGTCVQGEDATWQRCDAGGVWTPRSSSSGCAEAFAWCPSATLGKKVQPRTCVQAASDSKWYQCNGQTWVTPVDTATQSGPIGACSTFNALKASALRGTALRCGRVA